MAKADEVYAPAELDVEQLFDAEQDLRIAARDYSKALSAQSGIDAARKKLRDAARYYARVVDFFQGKD